MDPPSVTEIAVFSPPQLQQGKVVNTALGYRIKENILVVSVAEDGPETNVGVGGDVDLNGIVRRQEPGKHTERLSPWCICPHV